MTLRDQKLRIPVRFDLATARWEWRANGDTWVLMARRFNMDGLPYGNAETVVALRVAGSETYRKADRAWWAEIWFEVPRALENTLSRRFRVCDAKVSGQRARDLVMEYLRTIDGIRRLGG